MNIENKDPACLWKNILFVFIAWWEFDDFKYGSLKRQWEERQELSPNLQTRRFVSESKMKV